MTTAETPRSLGHFEFPDPPEREPDDMTSFDHLAATGNVRYLALHLGRPESTLVAGEHYLSLALTGDMSGLRYPDLLVAFGVDPGAYKARNAYVIDEQGKAPDFVLEIASRRTGREDTGPKRADYAELGVREYWRFDETGRYHGTRLAGDGLVGGRYEPIEIEELEDGILQGYSVVLDLHLRWEHGRLGWHDPATGEHIATLESEREARIQEREARITAEAGRAAAEDRIRELEERLRRQSS